MMYSKGEKMIKYIIIIIFLGASSLSFAESIDLNGNYWQCSSHDATNTSWKAKSVYQKIALNFSFAACKKNSQSPASCHTSKANCKQFISGVSITPIWQCTAFDRDANAWKSNHYPHREDAALAAKAYCKQKSSIPDTCYINLITCLNKQGM